jgi:hypothetical protein
LLSPSWAGVRWKYPEYAGNIRRPFIIEES